VWKRAFTIALDILIGLGCIVTILIAFTGGGKIDWGGVHVTAHQFRNPFLFIAILCVIRFTLTGIDNRAVSAVHRAQLALERVSSAGAWRYCGVLVAIVVVVRLYVAWTHPGFFTGDDVEIQEMTFARLFDWQWQAWALRNAFFPMAVIYPVQQVVTALGISGTHELVFAGRATVAVASSAALPILLWGLTPTARAVGLIAITILATSAVWLHLGATELPRPVAAVFVLAAYFMARRSTIRSAVAAGLLLGIAASFRFSELAFVPALALHMVFERRGRDAILAVAVALGTAAAILGLADYLYWGEPFASVRAIVDYTIVQRQSSRGYEPPWYYLSELTQWTDWVVAALCVVGMRREWRLALWILVPLALLSAMPHHEPRYTVPLLPLVALCAAYGLMAAAGSINAWSLGGKAGFAGSFATALPACLAASLVFQLSVKPVTSHDGAVTLARAVRSVGFVSVVVVEESWRWGNSLYFGAGVRVLDLTARVVADGVGFEHEVDRLSGDWIALRQDTCDRLQCAARLARLGYEFRLREPSDEPHAYVVFSKARR